MSGGLRDVAIVAVEQTPYVRCSAEVDEVELLQQVVSGLLAKTGVSRAEIGFTASGSCDFLIGRPFSFVSALDALGAWPPIAEEHLEMDAAWALYSAWVRLQHGDIDTALVYGFGRASAGDLPDVLVTQLDPYYVAPLWPDSISLAALQARALLDSGRYGERDFAEVAARSRRDALGNPVAQLRGDTDATALLAEPMLVDPLRKHDCAPISDGAAAVLLVAGEKARALCERPAWIRGIDHRVEPHSLGARDLTRSPSTRAAGERAGALGGDGSGASIEVAELHAPFSHQELILREALGGLPGARINPSGGALAANPMMVAGLARLGEAALAIHRGEASRALGHATSGPCLQQNLVCVLEASP